MKNIKLQIIFALVMATQLSSGVEIGNSIYDCKLTYEITNNLGISTVISNDGIFNYEEPYMNIQLTVPAPNYKAVVTLYNEGDEISLTMGDFCGDKFYETYLPKSGASKIYSKFFYGRDPETNDNWRTLTLECNKR